MAVTYARLYKGDPEYVDYTPGAVVTAGDVVVVGNNTFFATLDIPANVLGALAIGGQWQLPKATGTGSGWAIGTRLYWDAAARVLTATAASNKTVGIASAAAGDNDATAYVLSIPQAA